MASRQYLNKWFQDTWSIKFGIQFSFCRMLQNFLFLIFFNDNEMQRKFIEKQFWSIGNACFRVIPWTLLVCNEEIMALSNPKWVVIKNVPPFLWKCISKITEPLGKVIKIYSSASLLPHMDARVLIAFNPRVTLPSSIDICIDNQLFSCPLEYLGGINACHSCRRSGHYLNNCPLLVKKNGTSFKKTSTRTRLHPKLEETNKSDPNPSANPPLDPSPQPRVVETMPSSDPSPLFTQPLTPPAHPLHLPQLQKLFSNINWH